MKQCGYWYIQGSYSADRRIRKLLGQGSYSMFFLYINTNANFEGCTVKWLQTNSCIENNGRPKGFTIRKTTDSEYNIYCDTTRKAWRLTAGYYIHHEVAVYIFYNITNRILGLSQYNSCSKHTQRYVYIGSIYLLQFKVLRAYIIEKKSFRFFFYSCKIKSFIRANMTIKTNYGRTR